MRGQLFDLADPNETRKVICEVWSRCVGYYRPIRNFNKGKRAEFADRKVYDVAMALGEPVNIKEGHDAATQKLTTGLAWRTARACVMRRHDHRGSRVHRPDYRARVDGGGV